MNFKIKNHKAVQALKTHSVCSGGSYEPQKSCISRPQIMAGIQNTKRLSKLGWAKPMTYNPANDLLFNRCQHRVFNAGDRCLKCLMGVRSPASAHWICSWSACQCLARQIWWQFKSLLPELWLTAQAVRNSDADLNEITRSLATAWNLFVFHTYKHNSSKHCS